MPELTASAKRGVYDAAAVEALGTGNERDGSTETAPVQATVSDQKGPTAQKELYEVQFLADLRDEPLDQLRDTIAATACLAFPRLRP